MSIKINYTAYLRGDWQLILKKHLFMLVYSRLYENCDSFNIFAYPRNDDLETLVDAYGVKDKTEVRFLELNQQELPAIQDLVQDPGDYNLYFHTKGVTKKDKPRMYVPSLAWNDYMTYFNVLHWDVCVGLLEVCDAVGVEWVEDISNPNRHFYGGNFWWARRAHLERIGESEAFKDLSANPLSHTRYAWEHLVSSVPGTYAELYNSGMYKNGTKSLHTSPILEYRLDESMLRTHRI